MKEHLIVFRILKRNHINDRITNSSDYDFDYIFNSFDENYK